uniref:Uncharacterized protein n=1 Tax=Arundo donax TaxID=35708 RepID=A0A0A9H2P9_ARUDO
MHINTHANDEISVRIFFLFSIFLHVNFFLSFLNFFIHRMDVLQFVMNCDGFSKYLLFAPYIYIY